MKHQQEQVRLFHFQNLVLADDVQSGFRDNQACKLRDCCWLTGNAQPVAKIMIKGKPKLFAGFHEAEHGIAGDTSIPAHGAA